ncbi:Mu transposase C-terminal domain-containing protein [Rhodococcus sp. 7Tela_A2]|uniref:Mu transposase C-terminal domain-containing protein n=1 Tax=Rhodococcus sp. 7Tela_A2 TaxID=3093744 RepID=UPI003BB6A9D6
MAETLAHEAQVDRNVQRRLAEGEILSGAPNSSTIRNWVRAWRKAGLLALVDRRSTRKGRSWELIDPRYRVVAVEVVDGLDGDRSTVGINELDRRVRVLLKNEGINDVVTPQRLTRQFLVHLKLDRGETTRSQRSRALRHVSGTQHFPAIRPGQIVAIDATRADCLVFDPLLGRAFSVEILTAIDVATRVILALRVVPMSADGIDAGLLIYDVCRPFSMRVDGTTVGDWRWCGIPEALDCADVSTTVGRRRLSPDFSTLQGEHPIPSVMPDAIRCDHGSIFVSQHFRDLLQGLGIDLLLSRGKKPTDNPHVERWHETLQRGVQQIPGYKGRNTSERGRLVADEPLMTASELEGHLRRFVALDYHRSPHSGLILSGDPTARISPLEMWDAMLEATGRIDVPQHPDLIYQFLPIRWGTVRHAGVEFSNMVYDSRVLDEYRNVAPGQFRDDDRKVPFHVDPHDLSRIWFRDPTSGRVECVPWRGAHLTDAPMTDTILAAVRSRIRERGGNRTLFPGSASRQILDEIMELTTAPKTKEWKAKLSAGHRRVEQSRVDHTDTQSAFDAVYGIPPKQSSTVPEEAELDFLDSPWPSIRDRRENA